MGQGFSLTTLSAGSAGIDVAELSDLVYEKSMGTARFMKSIRARHQDGVVLVKVIVKPYAMKLEKYKRRIIRMRKCLDTERYANMGLQRSGKPLRMCRMHSHTNESSRRRIMASWFVSTSTALYMIE